MPAGIGCVVCSVCGIVVAHCGCSFHILFCSLSYRCVLWILSNILITLMGTKELVALLVFVLWHGYCL